MGSVLRTFDIVFPLWCLVLVVAFGVAAGGGAFRDVPAGSFRSGVRVCLQLAFPARNPLLNTRFGASSVPIGPQGFRVAAALSLGVSAHSVLVQFAGCSRAQSDLSLAAAAAVEALGSDRFDRGHDVLRGWFQSGWLHAANRH